MEGAQGQEPRTTKPKANGQNRMSKAKLETVRAAALAAHNAAGFLWVEGDVQCARLLRAAEALSRQALALLLAPPKQDDVSPPPPVPAEKATKKSKKKKVEKREKAKKQGNGDVAMGEALEPEAPQTIKAIVQAAPAGASVLVGDLRELGTDATMLVVPHSSASSGPSLPSAASVAVPRHPPGGASADQPASHRAAVSLAAQSPLVLRGWCKEAELPIVGKKKALVARLAGAVSPTSSCGALRGLAEKLAAPAPPDPGPDAADKVKFFEEQVVELRAQGFPEDDILLTESIARRDRHRHKLG